MPVTLTIHIFGCVITIVKLRCILGFFCPDKEILYHAYPFCMKHRLPPVLCWIYRWLASLFNPGKWRSVITVISRVWNS